MSREAAVLRSLVEVARALSGVFDVVELLTGLTERAVSHLGVSSAGVVLAGPSGQLRLLASSSEETLLLELLELQEGPGLEAFLTGENVSHDRLSVRGTRWPRFSLLALAAGFQSVWGLPLRLQQNVVGALILLGARPNAMDEDDMAIAQAIADLAVVGLVHSQRMLGGRPMDEQLNEALASRVLIEQAKGVIFQCAGVDLVEAFVRLRRYARRNDLLLSEAARRAIDGGVDPRVWTTRSLGSP